MGSEDFDERIRRAFKEHEPDVKGDWKRMQAALLGAAGGTTAAVVRARWVGGAAGATAVVAAVSGWLMWSSPDEVKDAESAPTEAVTQQQGAAAPSADGIEASPEARTRTAVVIPTSSSSAAGPVAPRMPTRSEALLQGKSNPSAGAAPLADADVISSSVKEACAGTEVTFSMEGDWAKGSILWNFGDGSFSNDVAPVHVFAKEGTYDITISMRSPNDGAIRTRTVEDMIVIRPKPDAQMAWKLEPTPTGSGVRVALEDKTPKASSATWMQGSKSVSSDALLLQGSGAYPITLVSSNSFGCQDSRTEVLRMGDRNGIDAPSTFSPDGDGKRDTFMPEGLRKGTFTLLITDMEGNAVFSTEHYKAPWDGRLADGSKAPLGSLFRWTVIRELTAGKPEFFSDRVRIER